MNTWTTPSESQNEARMTCTIWNPESGNFPTTDRSVSVFWFAVARQPHVGSETPSGPIRCLRFEVRFLVSLQPVWFFHHERARECFKSESRIKSAETLVSRKACLCPQPFCMTRTPWPIASGIWIKRRCPWRPPSLSLHVQRSGLFIKCVCTWVGVAGT